MDRVEVGIRIAEMADVEALAELIPQSVRVLQAGDYSPEQLEAAIGTVFGVDSQLILDGTYFVAEVAGAIVACGGWSRRKTLFGGDHGPVKDSAILDPHKDAARVRAFFVHPAWARRGIGRRIMEACEEAAVREGFQRLELAATLTGVPLYRSQGFTEEEQVDVPLANGVTLPVIRMTKRVGG